jgi:hypothetical protein
MVRIEGGRREEVGQRLHVCNTTQASEILPYYQSALN